MHDGEPTGPELVLETLPPGPADAAIAYEEARIKELGEHDARLAYLGEVKVAQLTALKRQGFVR